MSSHHHHHDHHHTETGIIKVAIILNLCVTIVEIISGLVFAEGRNPKSTS